MVAKPYVVLEERFQTQKALIKRIQAILYGRPLKEVLTGDDARFMREILSGHPQADEKLASGFEGIFAGKAKGGTICFYIKKPSGPPVDFSFRKCLARFESNF